MFQVEESNHPVVELRAFYFRAPNHAVPFAITHSLCEIFWDFLSQISVGQIIVTRSNALNGVVSYLYCLVLELSSHLTGENLEAVLQILKYGKLVCSWMTSLKSLSDNWRRNDFLPDVLEWNFLSQRRHRTLVGSSRDKREDTWTFCLNSEDATEKSKN